MLARRFAEAGVRFIQVSHSFKWDQHDGLRSGHESNAREVDRPIAGLLADLDARGLLGRCRIDDAAMPVGSVPARLFDWLMRTKVELVRERPHWAPPIPEATLWIVAAPPTRRVAAAVAWHRGNGRPLTVLDVFDARSWLVRFGWLLFSRDS